MSVETLADDELHENPDADRYDALADELRGLADVAEVRVEPGRSPARVHVTLSTANVTPHVEDRLDRYGAQVEAATVEVTGEGTLAFTVTTPEGFKPAGTRDAREYGSSTAWTFTREALELSGFDADTTLDARAREGAVLLTERRE